MDLRKTLNRHDSFLEQLKTLHLSGEKASLLFDDNGMTRAEGLVKAIHSDAQTPYIELDNKMTIALKTIVAVNGIFLPEYSEC